MNAKAKKHKQKKMTGFKQKYELHIRNAKVEDKGSYTCKAINGFGSCTVTIKLKILQGKICFLIGNQVISKKGLIIFSLKHVGML